MIEFLMLFASFICSASIFLYASKVFTRPVTVHYLLLVSAINSLLYYINIITISSLVSSAMMLTIYLLMFIEFKLVFKAETKITVFGVVCFGTVLFGLRSITMSVMALAKALPLHSYLSVRDNLCETSIISFFIMAIFLIVLYKLMPIEIVTVILSTKASTTFGIGILSTISAFICINIFSYFTPVNNYMINLLTLKVGITAVMGFGLVMFYSNLFSSFILKKQEVQNLENYIQQENQHVANLEKQKDKDFLTGLSQRNVAERTIEEYIASNVEFYVVYFDVDGLKCANDNFGHNEGDFYIKKVSEIIASTFKNDVCSRFGGDEFVVVAKDTDEYTINSNVNIIHNYVTAIKDVYKKEYSTSISYGVVNIKPNSNYFLRQILKAADDRMYAFKIKHKKQRR